MKNFVKLFNLVFHNYSTDTKQGYAWANQIALSKIGFTAKETKKLQDDFKDAMGYIFKSFNERDV